MAGPGAQRDATDGVCRVAAIPQPPCVTGLRAHPAAEACTQGRGGEPCRGVVPGAAPARPDARCIISRTSGRRAAGPVRTQQRSMRSARQGGTRCPALLSQKKLHHAPHVSAMRGEQRLVPPRVPKAHARQRLERRSQRPPILRWSINLETLRIHGQETALQ
jgi:hypothetical protein